MATTTRKRKQKSIEATRWKCGECGFKFHPHPMRPIFCTGCNKRDTAVHDCLEELLPLGATSTTTPAGIAAHDPDALDDDGATFSRREAADRQLAGEDLSRLPAVEAGRRHLNGNGKAAQAKARERLAIEYCQLAIELIKPSPTNPRKDFDKAGLEAMAHGMKQAGVLQPLIVRTAGADGKHELLAGERRWRSAKIAGLKTVPVRIVDVTDEEACEIQARENFDREDLNAIERARQFQHLLDTLKITQEALAKRYDLSQGEISNSIRLLRLPEAAHKLIISGEITPTEARDALVPYADMPELIEEAIRGDSSNLGYQVNRAAQKRARSMSDSSWKDKPRLFKPTPQQRKDLKIRHIWGEDYAFNVELYDRLQSEAAARQSKRADKLEAADGNGAAKETAEERRAKAKAQAEIFAKRLYRWKTAWLQGLVAERIVKADDSLILRLLLHFTTADGDRSDGLWQAIRTHGGKVRGSSYARINFWPALQKLSGDHPWKVARSAVLAWVQDDFEGWHCHISPEQIQDLAHELAIDVKREWKLTREFLELHNKAQLAKLIEEWDVSALNQASSGIEKRGELIDVILRHTALKCPKEVLEAKRVKLI